MCWIRSRITAVLQCPYTSADPVISRRNPSARSAIVANVSNSKVLAQRFQQDGVVMYVTALPARLINALGTVDTWQPGIPDDDEEQGYQREVVKSHARRIARYLLDENEEHLMPTAVLLSSREPLEFQPLPLEQAAAQAAESFGVLELRWPLYKVDGQHRTAGFELAIDEDSSLGGFPLPTVIMEVRNKMEEIRQFFTVNTTAKRVRTDLADRLLKAMGDFSHDTTKNWMLEALQIVDILNSEKGGPWEGGIKLPNSPGGIASQKTWTESLKPVLNGILSDQSPTTVAKALSNFWAALQDMMPEAFEEPNEHVLQKTTGVFSFNEVAAQIFKIAYREGSDLSKEALQAILMRGDDSGKFDAAFWANTQNGGEAPMYAGRGGMSRLAQEILEAIPEASTVKINL
jgi:DGQHR domain-containing protein